MKDRNGVWQDLRAGIEDTVVGYFQNIFHSRGVLDRVVHKVLEACSRRVTTKMNEELLRSYSEEEIQFALLYMHPSKAPGLDGMSPLFFQKFWHVVRHDVVNDVRSFLTFGRLL